jgi:Pyruvate/2-oxoacid:ferredoxin oxidoreductase gamma subunit
MLGALVASNVLPFGENEIIAVMKDSIPDRFLDLNTRALKFGADAFKKLRSIT